VDYEQRQAKRKVLKVRAQLTMDGAAPVAARTLDLSATGVCLNTPSPIKVGQSGFVTFELYFEAKSTPVAARCKASYCLLSSGEFKVGFEFVQLDMALMTLLAKFVR
jgi:hypothetical protein